MQALRIKSIKSLGIKPTLDLEVNHPDHNFYAEGMVTSNSHSVAYAALAAVCTYLKFKHPKEFFLSLLKMTRHEQNPMMEIAKIQKELRDFNIKLLPPHLLKSKLEFSIEGGDIRFGLLSIKGIADKSIERLNQFRQNHSNKFQVFQSANEAGMPIGILSALIQAGTLDEGLGKSRTVVVLEAQLWNLLTDTEKKYALEIGKSLDFDLFKVIKALRESVKKENGKPIIPDKRYSTIKKHYAPFLEIYRQNSKNEEFANWYYERYLLGYSCSTTLMSIFKSKEPDLMSIDEVKASRLNGKVLFIGTVSEVKSGVSKAKKTRYLKVVVEDEAAVFTSLIFNDNIDQCKILNGRLPKEDNIVIVQGTKKEDAVFANLIAIQDQQIFIRLADLTNHKKREKKLEKDSENQQSINDENAIQA